jgi:hypothetical protein
MTALELFQQLQAKFKATVEYRVGFNTEVSPDVLEIIKHLKGDLLTEDLLPSYPTSLSIVLRKQKEDGSYYLAAAFFQDSKTYLEAFDKEEFRKFAEAWLELQPTTN